MQSTTYYVSSLNGNDKNDGLSEKTPFATLGKINQTEIHPGDKILLEKGSVFVGQHLHLRECGDIGGEAIEISSYGEGDAMPRIDADGTGIWYQDYGTVLDNACHLYKGDVSSAVLLYDCENIILRNLEITNRDSEKSPDEYSAAHKTDRTGVAVVAQNRGTLHNITVENLFVHDVNGNVYNKHMNNGGIYMTCLKPADESQTGVARYDGVTVKNCYVKKVSRWGIAVGYTYRHKEFATKELSEDTFRKYGNENILICENYVKLAGGDAITPMYAL
ncbi:MAG: polyhydroxyalkanoate depolymerase, partial [Acutalibacteraceae bacterium]